MHHGRCAMIVDVARSRRSGFVFLGPLREILLISFSAGLVLSVIFQVNDVLLSDAESNEIKATKSRSNPIQALGYDSDRNALLVKSWVEMFEEISLVDLKTQRIETPENFVMFEASKTNSTIILMSQWAEGSHLKHGVRIVRENDVVVSEEFTSEFSETGEVRISADGSKAMFVGHEGTFVGWDLTSFVPCRWEFHLDSSAITNSLSPDGRRLFVISRDGKSSIRDSRTGAVLKTLPNLTDCSRRVAWTGDGRRFAFSGTDGTIFIFDTETGLEVSHFQDKTLFARVLKFSNDGQYLAFGGFDKTVQIWNVSLNEKEPSPKVLVGSTAQIGDFVFTEDGTKLIAGCVDGSIREWSMATRQMTRQIR